MSDSTVPSVAEVVGPSPLAQVLELTVAVEDDLAELSAVVARLVAARDDLEGRGAEQTRILRGSITGALIGDAERLATLVETLYTPRALPFARRGSVA